MRAWIILALALAGALFLGASAGYDWASPTRLAHAALGGDDIGSRLLIQWRLPHLLAAALVGALLGLSGAIFQGIFRNPLAEPYLLGTSGGAALGAAIALLVPLGAPQGLTLPVLAFAGALGSTALVISVSRAAGAIDSASLLLSGVAVAAILGAVRTFAMLALSDDTVNLQVVMSWTLGGIQTPGWSALAVLAAITAASLLLTQFLARGLDLLGLGEAMAASLGLETRRFVVVAVVAASVVVAGAVAFGGLVAFVGLASPHVARRLVGAKHRPLLIASALVGAIATVVCDAVARTALPPAEVPLGLITAVVGGPFFIILLARRLRQ